MDVTKPRTSVSVIERFFVLRYCFGFILEVEHHFMLVELPGAMVELVDNENAVTVFVPPNVCVDVVTVGTGGALDVSVMLRHPNSPRSICRAPDHPPRRLNNHVKAVDTDMPLAVVASLPLFHRWVAIRHLARASIVTGRGAFFGSEHRAAISLLVAVR